MASPLIGRRRRYPPGTARIDRTNPVTQRLVNMYWGAPQQAASGFETLTPTNRGGFGWSVFGPGVRGVGADTTNAVRAWPAQSGEAARSDLRPFTLFAAVHIDSTSERGVFVGMNTPSSDSGAHLGVGSGTFDSLGNGLICLHGNQAWKNSGQSIGVGSHTVAVVDTSSAVDFYVDGLLVNTQGASGCEAGAQFTTLAQQTSGASARSLTTGVVLSMGAAWYRALTAGEIAALHDDPYCMLRF